MQQLHKDNHYVPQVYLKQWAVEGRILAYRLLVPHRKIPSWKHHSLKGIAFHQHLYTQMVGGVECDDLERWLDSEFEAPAERAIGLAITDQRLAADEWRALIRFAIAQDVRTPFALRAFLRRQGEGMQSMLDVTVNDAMTRPSHGNLSVRSEKTANSNGFPLKVSVDKAANGEGVLRAEVIIGRAMWHWSLRHLLTNTIAEVSMKGWSIFKAANGCDWPTSDNPLIRLNYTSDAKYDFEGGWGVPNGDVMLPLSPTHILHRCAGKRSSPYGRQLDCATSEKIRRIIIEHADTYVFSQKEFSIDDVRERKVSLDLYNAERETWANWHAEQTQVEIFP